MLALTSADGPKMVLSTHMPLLPIRMAEPRDYEAYVRLVAELGVDDPVPDPERFRREMMPNTVVLEEQGRVLALAWYKTLETMGYVVQLVVEPGARRRGFGRGLMLELAARFRASGLTEWCLNVRPGNQPAIALYRSLGMREAYRSTVVRVPWKAVSELRDPAEASFAERLSPDRAAEVERSLGLPRGRLGEAMRTGGRIAIELRSVTASCLGVAVFDPAFPGAYPFRVADARWAKPLLLALLPHAPPEFSYLQLVVEADAELTRLLVSHGALARLEVLHLEGSLVASSFAGGSVFGRSE